MPMWVTYEVNELRDQEGERIVRIATKYGIFSAFKFEGTKLAKKLPNDEKDLSDMTVIFDVESGDMLRTTSRPNRIETTTIS